MKNIDIVFMGTPEFAVTILDKLVKDENINVLATVTAPDKPAGRGQKINQSEVKKYSVENNLICLQPANLKAEDFIEELSHLQAELFVVVAFRMLPQIVWNMPVKGTINLHGSLLPQYRGAAPINWAVINGENKTGVTTFFIEKEIDTGLVIEQESISIEINHTAGEVHDKLMHLGADLTLQSVKKIAKGEVERIPQEDLITEPLKKAPKIFKPDCEIDFNKPINEIHNFVRGLSPYPTAWFRIKRIKDDSLKTVKVFKTSVAEKSFNGLPLSLKIKDKQLYLQLKDGLLLIDELQVEGKRRLNAKQFITGFSISEWEVVK